MHIKNLPSSLSNKLLLTFRRFQALIKRHRSTMDNPSYTQPWSFVLLKLSYDTTKTHTLVKASGISLILFKQREEVASKQPSHLEHDKTPWWFQLSSPDLSGLPSRRRLSARISSEKIYFRDYYTPFAWFCLFPIKVVIFLVLRSD